MCGEINHGVIFLPAASRCLLVQCKGEPGEGQAVISDLCWERGLLVPPMPGTAAGSPFPPAPTAVVATGLIHPGIWDVTTSSLWWVAHHCGLRVDASSSCSHLRFCVPSPSLCAGRGHDHKILPWPDSGQREKNRWKT